MTDRPKPSFWIHFAAGGIGGTVGAAVTCPLEVVKTRLQSSLYRSNEVPFSLRRPFLGAWQQIKGVVQILQTIQQREGIRALWKGLGPNLVGIAPARSVFFSVYSQGKHRYAEMNGGRETPSVHVLSAATAGIATASFSNPIWLVKTRMQLQSEDPALRALQKYRNSFHCAYLVVKEEGFLSLYRGLSASILGIGESTIQFAIYEDLKRRALLSKRIDCEKKGIPFNDSLDWKLTVSIAGTAKLIAAIATYPHEVIRTRLRQVPIDGHLKYHGLVQTAKLIYKEEGISALYGGMTAHLMRVVPNAAILFFCYEMVVSLATDNPN